MFCHKCGRKLNEGSVICNGCGSQPNSLQKIPSKPISALVLNIISFSFIFICILLLIFENIDLSDFDSFAFYFVTVIISVIFGFSIYFLKNPMVKIILSSIGLAFSILGTLFIFISIHIINTNIFEKKVYLTVSFLSLLPANILLIIAFAFYLKHSASVKKNI